MRVVVGRIARAHGLRGEVSVEVRTDDPDARFAPGSRLLTTSPTVASLVIDACRWHSGRLLVTFEGVHDRTAAEALRGIYLEIDRDPAEVPDDEDEYYDSQLEDLDVVLATGESIGRTREVLHLPGQDLLAAVTPEGREILIPFVSAIVVEVDLDARRVVIDPPDGLLDDPSAQGPQ